MSYATVVYTFPRRLSYLGGAFFPVKSRADYPVIVACVLFVIAYPHLLLSSRIVQPRYLSSPLLSSPLPPAWHQVMQRERFGTKQREHYRHSTGSRKRKDRAKGCRASTATENEGVGVSRVRSCSSARATTYACRAGRSDGRGHIGRQDGSRRWRCAGMGRKR